MVIVMSPALYNEVNPPTSLHHFFVLSMWQRQRIVTAQNEVARLNFASSPTKKRLLAHLPQMYLKLQQLQHSYLIHYLQLENLHYFEND